VEPCFACFWAWYSSRGLEGFGGLFGLLRSIEEECHTALNGPQPCSLRILGNILFLIAFS
jgi:hypothetical protein